MIEIKQINEKEKYMELLLEADPNEKIIKEYLPNSDMFGFFENNEILAEIVITKVNENICELKNIATMKKARKQGYASKLIEYVFEKYKNQYDKIIVGTTENNIPFYVKCGFDKYYKTLKNFFVDNYSEEIWDGNLHCIDMYYYYKDLNTTANDLKKYVRSIPNFPSKGVMFRDITTILQDKNALKLAIETMQRSLGNIDFDIIVAAESRGFIFGMPIAYNLNKAFVPIRKKGKLPYETISESYNLEYGQATLEIHKDSIKKGQKVVIIDDLIATGGTLEAMIKLVERLGGKVVKISCLIDLPDLKGKERLNKYDIFTAMEFEGK